VISNSKYLALCHQRKIANWEADFVTADRLYNQMKEMIKKDQVTDEELEASAYV
tara:strand:+ start:8403 stop:8564 length:162 start_codon:yes stop_codon:yes gene_type:complete